MIDCATDDAMRATLKTLLRTSGIQSLRYLYLSSSDLQLRRHSRSKSPGVEGGSVGKDVGRAELRSPSAQPGAGHVVNIHMASDRSR